MVKRGDGARENGITNHLLGRLRPRPPHSPFSRVVTMKKIGSRRGRELRPDGRRCRATFKMPTPPSSVFILCRHRRLRVTNNSIICENYISSPPSGPRSCPSARGCDCELPAAAGPGMMIFITHYRRSVHPVRCAVGDPIRGALLLTLLPHLSSPLNPPSNLHSPLQCSVFSHLSHFVCKTAMTPRRRRLVRSLIALATAIKVALLGNELEARAARHCRTALPFSGAKGANPHQIRIRKAPTKGGREGFFRGEGDRASTKREEGSQVV